MYIRFVGGGVDADSHVEKGLFRMACELMYDHALPDYELERLLDLLGWFNANLYSPFEFRLRRGRRRRRAICWFKSSAREHLAKAYEMAALLESNGLYIRTIKSEKVGYTLYEDDAQVFAQPFIDMRLKD